MDQPECRIVICSDHRPNRVALRDGLRRFALLHARRWEIRAHSTVEHRLLGVEDGTRGILVVHEPVPAIEDAARTASWPVLPVRADGLWYDPRGVATVAARHLVEHGWRHAAIWPPSDDGFCDRVRRDRCFIEAFQTLGGETLVLDRSRIGAEEPTRREVARLPAGTALFAHDDRLAEWLLAAIRACGRAIPDEIGCIACNDSDWARDADPPLTSVRTPWSLLAEQAALAIARLLSTGDWGELPLLQPVGVAERASTHRPPVQDPLVARALTLIRRALPAGLRVAELARRLDVSRDTVERRFRRAGLDAPAVEILRRRLGEAERLLCEMPDVSISEVARRCGWRHVTHFGRDFRVRHGCPPSTWRRGLR